MASTLQRAVAIKRLLNIVKLLVMGKLQPGTTRITLNTRTRHAVHFKLTMRAMGWLEKQER